VPTLFTQNNRPKANSLIHKSFFLNYSAIIGQLWEDRFTRANAMHHAQLIANQGEQMYILKYVFFFVFTDASSEYLSLLVATTQHFIFP
jgi:hypothetical protein